ncbi:hypothetical protein [Corallococcus aberystwythensis]|uniref:hypothetical protein n=1 Tax=Corallococcus aberystwythensis TaxID=2316722 RepID=UPI0011C43572|nr:hypothetical protein [Corallococcus aberystwythensis]
MVKHKLVVRLHQRRQLLLERLHVARIQRIQRADDPLAHHIAAHEGQQPVRDAPEGPLQRLDEEQVPGP